MKRGLVVLDPAEIPDSERTDRLTKLQTAMAADGIDVALVYGDVSRSDDIAYLTNLCIYWNEGILAVPAHGDPAFLTKLSPRVFGWMRQVSTITDIHSGRKFGDLAAKYLEQHEKTGTIGLIDAALWPASVADEIRQALPGRDIRDAGDLVRALRRAPSAAELGLLRAGGALLDRCAAAATADGLADAGRIAQAERDLRGGGFLDVMAGVERTADGVVTTRITGQYRYLWLHASRLAETGNATTWPAALRTAIGAATVAAAPGVTTADLDEAVRPLLADLPPGTSVTARWTDQGDMATNGEYADDPAITPGSVVVVSLEARFPGGGYATVAETVYVGEDGPVVLTRH